MSVTMLLSARLDLDYDSNLGMGTNSRSPLTHKRWAVFPLSSKVLSSFGHTRMENGAMPCFCENYISP